MASPEVPNVGVRKRNREISLSEKQTQLIGYESAPVCVATWIHLASQTLMQYESEAGRRIATFNVKRVALADIRPSDIGIAATEQPDEDEQCDCDFLASSNIIFYEFLGSPGETAYIRCIGYLGNQHTSSEHLNRRFTVLSPPHFLVAAGDFTELAAQLVAKESGSTTGSAGEPREKRSAQRAQEAGGERLEGEKGVSYCIVTRDGQRLPTRDKKDLQVRCDHLELMWRAADRGLWKYMAGSGYRLQPDIYWKTIIEEAEILEQPEGSVFRMAGKVSLLYGTTIAKDTTALGVFLRGDFGEDELGLDSFCAGSKLSMAAYPCVLQNAPLVSAIEALASALEVLFSSQFAGVCDQLIEALRGHVRPLRLTDSGFLVHSVERVFVRFFRTISKEESALCFPDSDVTNPAGCASLLRMMIAGMIEEMTDVSKATILEKRYTIMARGKRVQTATPAVTRGQKGKPVASVQEPAVGESDVDQCGSHLGQLLKVKKKNGSPLKCVKGSSCKYKHGKLTDFSKDSAMRLVATMPVWLQDCLTGPVMDCKVFKV